MKTPDAPIPSALLMEAGRRWADERAYDSRRRNSQELMKKLYVAGVMLWHVHRRQIQRLVTEGGGITRVNSALSGGLNYAELANGNPLYAADILQTPSLVIATSKGTTTHTEQDYTQTHKIHIGFGGKLIGGEMESTRWQINERPFSSVGFKELIDSETFFPDEFGVVERVKTKLNPGTEAETTHTEQACYSLFGQIWGTNPFFASPMPDPYTEPVAYRQWALNTDPVLDLSLQASIPTRDGSMSTRVATVIDKYGTFKPNGEIALTSLERFRVLLGHYAYSRYPELFPVADGRFTALAPELPTHSDES